MLIHRIGQMSATTPRTYDCVQVTAIIASNIEQVKVKASTVEMSTVMAKAETTIFVTPVERQNQEQARPRPRCGSRRRSQKAVRKSFQPTLLHTTAATTAGCAVNSNPSQAISPSVGQM